jgi:hypothetical protein
VADKLAAVGLIPRRGTVTLDSFIRVYVESRQADLKPRTLMKLRTTHHAMVGFYGADRNLRDITPGDADEWRLHMLNEGLTENTVRKHVSIAKQFFDSAVRKRSRGPSTLTTGTATRTQICGLNCCGSSSERG